MANPPARHDRFATWHDVVRHLTTGGSLLTTSAPAYRKTPRPAGFTIDIDRHMRSIVT
jgi:hypothetical protein